MSDLRSGFRERDEEICCSLLALLSGEHILFLGPPGTAKSLLSKTMCEAIDGDFFYYLLTRFTTPEEIFGPLSIKALQQDELKRNIRGYLPTANVAFLDEVFKANSSILNSILTILNERKYHNGNTMLDVPLISVFGASNELPEENESLEALYDRFLFRCMFRYIQDDNDFKELIFDDISEFKPSAKLSVEKIKELQAYAPNIKVDADVERIVLELRKELREKNIQLSDRRWKKIVRALKIASASIDKKTVDRTMVMLLQHMTWDVPDQKEHIRNTLIDLIISGGESIEKLKQDVDDLHRIVQRSLDQKFPLRIRCYDCGLIIESSSDMIAHWKIYPGHHYYDPYRTSISLRYFSYRDMVKVLKDEYGWNFVENVPLKMTSFRMDTEDLKKRLEYIMARIGDDFDSLRKLLSDNIWLSRNNKLEILNRYENKLKLLEDISEGIGIIESMIEQNEPQKDRIVTMAEAG